MVPKKPKIELKKISTSKAFKDLSAQLSTYEKKIRKLTKAFNLTSQETKKKGRQHLDRYIKTLKKARTDLEKRASKLLHQETQQVNRLLNEKAGDLLNSLKKLSAKEAAKNKAAKKSKAKGKAKKKTRKTKGKKVKAASKSAKTKKKTKTPKKVEPAAVVTEEPVVTMETTSEEATETMTPSAEPESTVTDFTAAGETGSESENLS